MRTWSQRLAVGLVAAGGLLVAAPAAAQEPDPLIGVWVLDLARSSFQPGPAPRRATVTAQAAGTAVKITIEAVTGEGAASKWSFTTERDGQEVPVTGNPAYDAAASTRESPTAGTTTYKKAGKVVITARTTISDDGRILTVASQGLDPLGRAVNNVAVYERK